MSKAKRPTLAASSSGGKKRDGKHDQPSDNDERGDRAGGDFGYFL